jgi:hypothetical protein
MNRSKFKALVHYVIAKSDSSRLGSIRLNKILWFVDTLTYRAEGESVTGGAYVKRQFGPVPKHILSMLGELEHENAIVIRERDRFGYVMKDYVALTDPDVSSLSAKELALADELSDLICNAHTAESISELSHDQIWDAANIGEEIPMWAALASRPGQMTKEVAEWADTVISRYEKQQAA